MHVCFQHTANACKYSINYPLLIKFKCMVTNLFVLSVGRILIFHGVIPIVQRVQQNSPTAGIPAILCSKPHSSRSIGNFFVSNFWKFQLLGKGGNTFTPHPPAPLLRGEGSNVRELWGLDPPLLTGDGVRS